MALHLMMLGNLQALWRQHWQKNFHNAKRYIWHTIYRDACSQQPPRKPIRHLACHLISGSSPFITRASINTRGQYFSFNTHQVLQQDLLAMLNKENLRNLIAGTSLVITNEIQIDFSAHVTLKFDRGPRKTIENFHAPGRYYITS